MLQWRLADRLVYQKVRAGFGGRLRGAFSGGAPLAKEIMEFFDPWGYASSRGTGSPSARRARRRTGSTASASAPSGAHYRTSSSVSPRTASSDPQPDVFAGYYKDPEATAAVLDDDGWLRSGDIAEIDDDGFVTITDRKKDIIVTAGGKNIAPQNLENDLKTSKYVSQALVIGDRRPYPAVLITLDATELEKWAAEQGIDGDPAALVRSEQVHELVQGIVDDVNRERSRFEQIKRFVVLPQDFTIEGGELTPTLKVRRRVVLDRYSDEVEGLYDAVVGAGFRPAGRPGRSPLQHATAPTQVLAYQES